MSLSCPRGRACSDWIDTCSTTARLRMGASDSKPWVIFRQIYRARVAVHAASRMIPLSKEPSPHLCRSAPKLLFRPSATTSPTAPPYPRHPSGRFPECSTMASLTSPFAPSLLLDGGGSTSPLSMKQTGFRHFAPAIVDTSTGIRQGYTVTGTTAHHIGPLVSILLRREGQSSILFGRCGPLTTRRRRWGLSSIGIVTT